MDLPKSRITGIAVSLTFVLLSLYCFFLSLTQLSDPDLWFHLRTGQMTLETGQLPGDIDPFSYTTPNPIPPVSLKGIRTQWLGQAVFYVLFEGLGAMGFAILRSLMVISPFLFIYFIALRRGASPPALLFLVGVPLFLMAHAGQDTFERPQVFSFLLVPVVYLIALRLRRLFSIAWAAALVAMMMVWANLHGGYIVGLAMLAAVAAGGALSIAYGKFYTGGYFGDIPERPKALFLALLVALLATGINPAGWIVHQWAVGLIKAFISSAGSVARAGDVMHGIKEYKPVWSFLHDPAEVRLYAVIAFYLLALISLALKYTARRAIDLSEAFAACIMVFFGTAYMRGVSFALIFMAMLASLSVVSIKGKRLFAVSAMSAIVITVLGGYLALYRPWMLSPRPPAYWISSTYPENSLRFLDEREVRGRMFNLMEWGGYISWRSYPSRQVFFDGREISAGVMKKYNNVLEGRPGWRRILDDYGVDILLVPILHGSNGILTPTIFRMVLEGPGPWRLVYLYHNQVVFLRAGAQGTQGAIECCQMPLERLYKQIVDVAALKLLEKPGYPDIMLSQAFGLYWSGRNADAMGVLNALPENPVAQSLRRDVTRALGSR